MIPTISKRFYIFVCVDGLLRLVPSQKSGQSIKWSEWGIDNTRWFVNESEYRQRNAPLVGSSHRGMSGPRYVELINNSEDRGNGRDDEGDKDNGGDKTPVDQRKDKKDEDGLLYVADFKVSHSRMDLDQALTSENQNLIRHGRFPFPAQNYRVSTNIIPETGPGSPHNIPQYNSERMRTILVRSDAPTILGEEDGFDEPVESRLPYRFVAGRRPVPRVISRWLMSHNITAGLQIATPNITAIIYELRPPTQ
ncbi:unnamed protein product [Rhizoctonia solani]|uniref:Uncharacterized protein n=1 Tax=Rhizoctonia solani TaxID=456999 RepID=A0A8H3APQ2_9AGAM|nr:unnamed protein product [Rhizoctonia solani]